MSLALASRPRPLSLALASQPAPAGESAARIGISGLSRLTLRPLSRPQKSRLGVPDCAASRAEVPKRGVGGGESRRRRAAGGKISRFPAAYPPGISVATQAGGGKTVTVALKGDRYILLREEGWDESPRSETQPRRPAGQT